MTAWDEVPWSSTGVPVNLDSDHVPSRPDDVLRLLRRCSMSGVVVTARSPRGPVRLVTTSLTVLSTDPPTVSFVVAATDPAWRAVCVAGHLGFHPLGPADEDLAAYDGTPAGGDEVPSPPCWWPGPHRVPLLDGPAGWLVAQVQRRRAVGDQVTVVAQIRYSGVRAGGGNPRADREGVAHVQLGNLRVLRPGRRGWLRGARPAGAGRLPHQPPLPL